MKKILVLLFLVTLAQFTSAQIWNVALDTIEIKVRDVLRLPRFAIADSSFLVNYSQSDLGQLIQLSGIGTANKYGGTGSIASVRNAGVKPEFIAVEWNGMAINSLSLGMADVSLIPTFFIDHVSFNESNFEWGQRNTGIGGNLKLSSSFSASPSLEFKTSYSSLRNGFLGVKWKEQRGKNRIDLRVLDEMNRNEFYYTDPYLFEAQTLIQRHNDTHLNGIQFGVQHSAKGGVIESRFMLVRRNAELPEALGGLSTLSATQDDRLFKWSTSYKPRTIWQWNKLEGMKEFALFVSNDYNNYRNIRSDSKVTSSQVALNSAFYWRGEKGFIQNQTNVAFNEVNYSDWKGLYHWMHVSSYFSAVRNTKWGEYLVWFKPEYRTDQKFISSMEAALQIPSNKNWKWKWSGSRIARFPTANELYWQPGGNPYLKPEIGSWIKTSVVVSKSKWQWDGESKCGWISNWIQWSPINNQVWSPMNIKFVRLWQTTFGLTYKSKFRTGSAAFNASLQHSSSMGRNENSTNSFQMIYTPKWKSHTHLDLRLGPWSALISANYLSPRYTDEANSVYTELPSIFLADLSVSRLVKLDSNHLELHIGVSIENLTNVNYQWIRGYITPGSVYTLNLKLSFK